MNDTANNSLRFCLLAVACGIPSIAHASRSIRTSETIPNVAPPTASELSASTPLALSGPVDPMRPLGVVLPAELLSIATTSADSAGEHGIPRHPALFDRFFFGVGAFAASSTTEARLDSPSGIGTTVDFEDLLGLDSNDIVPQGLARWRFSDRWRLELEYFDLNRSNTKQVSGEIVWGDETFPVNTTVSTEFNISVARLSCGYSFYKRPDKEVGVALGFHLMDIEIELSGGGANADDAKALAPLPVVSMYGQVALTDTWAISSRLDAFRIAYDPYEGHVFSIGVDALWQPWRHVGMGFGWRSLAVEFSADHDDWEGQANTNYQGPIAFVSFSF